MDVVTLYTPDEFKTFFRLSRTTVESFLQLISRTCQENNIKGITDRIGEGGCPQRPLQDRLLILLFYMSTLDKYQSIAHRFGLGESRAHNVVHTLVKFISQHLVDTLITWPSNDEKQEMKDMFYGLKGFPGVIGMIDGTHIKIDKPAERGFDYFNRKDYYSLVLQAVVREDLRFTDICTGWPGKVHDARVFRCSRLYESGSILCGNDHLLGDCAYPNLPWLLVPFRDDGRLTPDQVNYNKVHASIRSTVERAFGLLKGRFTRLRYINQRNNATIVHTIVTACVLHNLCIIHQDDVETVLEAQVQPEQPFPNLRNDAVPALENAAVKRLNIARRLPPM